MNCLFCQIVNREKKAYIIAENAGAIAILDVFPVSDGHALIITKQHFNNIAEVNEKSWEYLLPLIKKIINKLKNTKLPIFPQGFNIISNMNEDMEKKIAYQSIPHLHIHIIPKYAEKEGFTWTAKPVLKYNLEQVAEKLKNAI